VHDDDKEHVMTSGLRTIVYPVKDLDHARAVYTSLLGVPPYTDEPWYVGFRVGDQELGLDPHGHGQGMTGPVGYWHVEDIRASVQQLLDAGAQVQQEVRDVGGGRLVATVTDSDGNVTGLVQSA
jgi:predicted enzyme related to lactoylglutathione lyase